MKDCLHHDDKICIKPHSTIAGMGYQIKKTSVNQETLRYDILTQTSIEHCNACAEEHRRTKTSRWRTQIADVQYRTRTRSMCGKQCSKRVQLIKV
jgi:hypothetical protein